jgi:hypothetical protein
MRDGEVADLTEAESVKFTMKPKDGTTAKLNAVSASFVDKPNGKVQYQWTDGDTDEPGEYEFEFKVIWPDSRPEYFPSDGYKRLDIDDNLED